MIYIRNVVWNENTAKQTLLQLYQDNENKPYSISYLVKKGHGGLRAWLYSNYNTPIDFCIREGIPYVIKNGRTDRKWTVEALKEAIKDAYKKKGSPVYDKWMTLNGFATPLSRIKRDGMSLFDFAKENGLEEYVQIKYNHKGYSKEEIKKSFLELYHNIKEPLCDTLLKEHGLNKQVSYLRKHYGTLDSFIEETELSSIFKKRYEILTTNEVIRRVRNLSNSLGRPISMKDIQNNDSGSAQYIYRQFGDWKRFCETHDLGNIFDYRGGETWDDVRVVTKLIKLSEKLGRKVNSTDAVSEYGYGLEHHIRRNFDGWPDFIDKMSIDKYVEIRKTKYTDEDVVSIIKGLYERNQNQPLSYSKIRDLNGTGIFGHISRQSLSIEEFAEKYEIGNLIQREKIKWSDEVAVSIINRLYDEFGEALTYSDIEFTGNDNLLQYIRRVYGRPDDFIEKFQLHDKLKPSDFAESRFYGRQFEYFLKEIFEALGYDYHFQYTGFDGIRPDFYDKINNIILDAKLSSHTVFKSKSEFFKRYVPVCEKVIIVYLRGQEFQSRNEKFEWINVRHYFSELERLGRGDLVEKVLALKQECEDMTVA